MDQELIRANLSAKAYATRIVREKNSRCILELLEDYRGLYTEDAIRFQNLEKFAAIANRHTPTLALYSFYLIREDIRMENVRDAAAVALDQRNWRLTEYEVLNLPKSEATFHQEVLDNERKKRDLLRTERVGHNETPLGRLSGGLIRTVLLRNNPE